jgi:DNA-directed RNA polymerase subunit RPC12/RpoP
MEKEACAAYRSVVGQTSHLAHAGAVNVLRFRCPACDKSIKASESQANRRGKCPHCGAAVAVPANGANAAEQGTPPVALPPSAPAAVSSLVVELSRQEGRSLKFWATCGIAAAMIAAVSATISWVVATHWQSPAVTSTPVPSALSPAVAVDPPRARAASQPAATPGFATPEACFAAYQKAIAADDAAATLECLSEEMVRMAAAQIAVELQRSAFMDPSAPPAANELLKQHQLDDLDIMGMLQIADSPSSEGPSSVFRTVGASIAEPEKFVIEASKIVGRNGVPKPPMEGSVVILKIEGDHAVGQLNVGELGVMPIHFARDGAGWKLSLPPEIEELSRPERSLPSRQKREELRAQHERQEQIRAQNREVHEATFAAAWLFGQTTGKFDMLATGEDRRTIAGGVIAPVYVRFEGSETPILLSSLSEAEAALYLEVPYAERHNAVPALIIKSPDANGITRYSNHQGTDVTFQYGQLKYFSSDSPFIEYSIVREGPAYTMPMTLEQAEKLFGRPLSSKSDRDPQP